MYYADSVTLNHSFGKEDEEGHHKGLWIKGPSLHCAIPMQGLSAVCGCKGQKWEANCSVLRHTAGHDFLGARKAHFQCWILW